MMLNQLLVIELASVLAGPSVGMWLAELGATVIKVEHHRRGGDVTRSWRLAGESLEDDRPAYFSAVNWGKASIGLDLSAPAAREVVYALIEQADVVLASYKPGDAEKLGMDAETLQDRNPRLVYADLTAYGSGDERVGYDAIIQAEAGFTYMNGHPETGPVKMPVALMDLLAAHQLKEGILLALLERTQTGRGRHVRTSLIGAGVASLANQATNWLVAGHVPKPMGSDHPNIVPYGTIFYDQAGKGLVLAVGSDAQFQRLAEVLGQSAWMEDERFNSPRGRVAHREVVKGALQDQIGGWERSTLLEALRKARVPAGALMDMPEVFEQAGAQQQLFQGSSMQGLRSVALENWPPQLDLSEPPHLGAEGDAILRQYLSWEEDQISELRNTGLLH